jgi:hypothetical protein
MIPLPIDAAGVAAVSAIEDPALRNLWITQSYADFSVRLGRAFGGPDLTWCGFGVWASNTAGQSIRRQEIPGVIADVLGASDGHQACIDAANRRLRALRFLHIVPALGHVHVLRTFDGAIDAVSDHIAHGNTLVYGELAPLFVAFLERVEGADATAITDDDVDAALAGASTGPVPADVVAAFRWYRRALVATDATGRAFAVLAGNVLAVAHEQQRLQVDVVDAMDAGLVTAAQVIDELMPHRTPDPVVAAVTKAAGPPLQELVDSVWGGTMTKLLMTLRVPGAALRLRDDLPPLSDGRLFPTALAELLDDPEELAEAVGVFGAWDRTHGTGRHDGAHDWAVLGDRMNYIVNLFRSRQQDPTLAVPPFTAEQLAAMQAMRMPEGPLLPPHPAREAR